MKRILITILCGCTGIFLSTPTASANDQIISAFGSKVAQAMCADGGAWLDAYNTPREKCPQISQSVLGPCMKKVLEGRAVPLRSEADLQQVSQDLYGCMKDAFLATYGGSAKQ